MSSFITDTLLIILCNAQLIFDSALSDEMRGPFVLRFSGRPYICRFNFVNTTIAFVVLGETFLCCLSVFLLLFAVVV